MAMDVISWAKDGRGECQIKATRTRNKTEYMWALHDRMNDKGCVRVTLERTGSMPNGKRAPIKTLWIKPGYSDPF